MIGQPNLITFDIGGTTCDVSLIKEGQPLLVRDRLVEGYPVLAPFIDIHSIGAGGGTIAWADQTGMLHISPHSTTPIRGQLVMAVAAPNQRLPTPMSFWA